MFFTLILLRQMQDVLSFGGNTFVKSKVSITEPEAIAERSEEREWCAEISSPKASVSGESGFRLPLR
jgi:hypothetical protein